MFNIDPKLLDKLVRDKIEEFNTKQFLTKNQLIKNFFLIHPPAEIQKKVKDSLNDTQLPEFKCEYKISDTLNFESPFEFIRLVNEEDKKYFLADFQLLIVILQKSCLKDLPLYKIHRKALGSDFYFKIEGIKDENRLENSYITLNFGNVHKKPFF